MIQFVKHNASHRETSNACVPILGGWSRQLDNFVGTATILFNLQVVVKP